MLSLWQSGAYRLMDDDVPYPSALPTAEGAPTPYKDDDGGGRLGKSGAKAPDRNRGRPLHKPPPPGATYEDQSTAQPKPNHISKK